MPLERLRPPDEGGVLLVALGIRRLEEGDLPALLVEVAAQFAGDIHHPQAAVVVTHIEDVVLDPEVVAAGFGNLITRHFPAFAGFVPFPDVDPAGGAVGQVAFGLERIGEVLVPGEDQHLPGGFAAVREAGVVPAVRVAETAHHHRVVRRAALAAAADVHRHDPVGPVRGPGDAVLHPHIVDAVARGIEFETPHPVGILRVLGVQDVVTPPGGERQDVVVGDEHIVDAAGEFIVVPGKDPDAVGRVRHIEDHQPVLPVGGALPADDGEAAVRGDLHIVHRPGVHPHGVHQVDARRVGHIPEVGVPVGAPGAGHGVVASVQSFPDPEVGGMPVAHRPPPDDLPVLPHLTRCRADGPPRGQPAPGDHHRVEAGPLGHEGAVRLHESGGAGRHQVVRRPREGGELQREVGHLVPGGVERPGAEPDHIPGARFFGVGAEFEARRRVRPDAESGFAPDRFGSRRKRRPALGVEGQRPVLVHRGHPGITRLPGEVRFPLRPGGVFGEGAHRKRGAGVEVRRERGHRDALERREGHGYRDLDPERHVGAAVHRLRVARRHRH